MSKNVTIFKRFWYFMLMVGPGFFCIGYTIGTGSVTSMVKAGSQFGTQLIWVLFLSCLFSWVMMEAYGRYAIVSGGTSIYSFKTRLKFGKPMAILIIIGIVFGQWNSLTGILGITSNAIYEVIQLFTPDLDSNNYWYVLIIAAILIIILYLILLIGNYSAFEQVLVFFVTLMGISFIVSMFIVPPKSNDIFTGFVPIIPKIPGAKLMVAAFVGTTMASPTFIVRPLLMKGKGWTKDNYKDQRRDAFVSALLMFIISGSIMIVATGALFCKGQSVEKVLDMVNALKPLAGRFAVSLFLVGTLSAGLSSVFPILMVAPLLISDYKNGNLETKTKLFRLLTGIACIFGLVIPILGVNPIFAQILTQVFNVFILPLVVLCIIILINRKSIMGKHTAGNLLNIGLISAFVFSILISYTGVLALIEIFSH